MKPINRRTFLQGLAAGSVAVLAAPSALSACETAATLFSRDRPHLNVGAMGHVGHGKTTLTSAITRELARSNLAHFTSTRNLDSDPAEIARSISIATSLVEYETPHRHYAHVDCPGHPDYVENAAKGFAQMDAAILVLGCDDGPMPQTREHIAIAHRIGVEKLIVFLNKIDLVDDTELRELVIDETRNLLTAWGYPGDEIPVISGCASSALAYGGMDANHPSNQCIRGLLDAMDSYFTTPERDQDKPFLMPVANTYWIPGCGAVAAGRIHRGSIRPGDKIDLLGYGRDQHNVRVLSMESFHKRLDTARAGDRAALLLENVARDQLHRGQTLAAPGAVSPVSNFSAGLYIFDKKQGGRHTPFMKGYRPQFIIGTADMDGEIAPSQEMVFPGDTVSADISLRLPLVMAPGQGFSIREGSRTIALGTITQTRS